MNLIACLRAPCCSPLKATVLSIWRINSGNVTICKMLRIYLVLGVVNSSVYFAVRFAYLLSPGARILWLNSDFMIHIIISLPSNGLPPTFYLNKFISAFIVYVIVRLLNMFSKQLILETSLVLLALKSMWFTKFWFSFNKEF